MVKLMDYAVGNNAQIIVRLFPSDEDELTVKLTDEGHVELEAEGFSWSMEMTIGEFDDFIASLAHFRGMLDKQINLN